MNALSILTVTMSSRIESKFSEGETNSLGRRLEIECPGRWNLREGEDRLRHSAAATLRLLSPPRPQGSQSFPN